MKKMLYRLFTGLLISVGWSCSSLEPPLPAADQVLDGPLANLTSAESIRHARGDAAFNGQIFTGLSGLGPLFVATSCGSCHAGDGKGHPFTSLIRFGQNDSTGNHYLDQGGPQLQNRALPGYKPETVPAGVSSTVLMPPANTGLGYLELVSESDILSLADPLDLNHDGISGVANYNTVPYYIEPYTAPRAGKYLCRFGKKAGAYNLLHQTVNAYNQDIGITSDYAPTDTYSGLNADPEVSSQVINDVVFYLQTLKAPVQRDQNDGIVARGLQIFKSIGCQGCHRETLTTGYSTVESLSNKEFHPFTDLLLHDMGPALDDGYTEGTAKTSEWRTPPLWGLGLSPKSQGGQYFLLHDGRAGSIESAIQMHGGEAATTQAAFSNLPPSDQDALIRFLKSL